MSTAKDWKWVATNSPVANSRTDDIWFFDEKKLACEQQRRS